MCRFDVLVSHLWTHSPLNSIAKMVHPLSGLPFSSTSPSHRPFLACWKWWYLPVLKREDPIRFPY